MDINQVLMDYDNMFGTHSLEDIEEFLTTNIEVAMDERDYASALSLLNEMMGLCRDTNQNAKGLRYCADIEDILVKMGMEGTVEYATSLLNVANAYRTFGYYMKAQNLFERVEVLYREKLSAGDYRFATLYNNWAFVYQGSGELKKAEETFRRHLRRRSTAECMDGAGNDPVQSGTGVAAARRRCRHGRKWTAGRWHNGIHHV